MAFLIELVKCLREPQRANHSGVRAVHCTTPCVCSNKGNAKGGSNHYTIDLLFDCFGLVCFASKNKNCLVVIQLIPNQSNRRSMVQWYFPLKYSLSGPFFSSSVTKKTKRRYQAVATPPDIRASESNKEQFCQIIYRNGAWTKCILLIPTLSTFCHLAWTNLS